MGDFAIVGEGITDQMVLENILIAWFQGQQEPLSNYVQPPNDATGTSPDRPPGGSSLVIDYFKKQKFIEALQTNAYLVTQLDTDVANEYGVPHRPDDKAMIAAVIDKLLSYVPNQIKETHGHRFLFAITHQTTECWLLPLVEKEAGKRRKIVNCVKALHEACKRSDRPVLGNKEHKYPAEYDRLSSEYAKRKDVVGASVHNAGFAHFVDQLGKVTLTSA